MLGLNLNTNIPYSPVGEVPCNATTAAEEEVDAVTGKKDHYSLLSDFIFAGSEN